MAGEGGFLIVGTVHKPHGIKGELAVRVETDHPAAVFRVGNALLLGDARGTPTGGRITVERARPFKGGLLLKAAEHAGRDAVVDALRGATLLIPAAEAAPLEAHEAFVHQLVGLRVQAEGEVVGTVAEVYEAPAGWYLGVSRVGRKELLVPFVREMIRRVDPAEGVVEVELPAGLLDLLMKIRVVTLFPDFFRGPLGLSIPARAAAAGLVAYELVQLRDFTRDRHQTVDDLPYGGGSGMVMKPEPFFEAVESVAPEGASRPPGRILLMSARGKRFTHADAVRLSLQPELTLLCGHYKDVDHRVAEALADEEVSLGDFVLSGGEVAALAVLDAVVRLLPGAISDHESASTDSFYDGELSPPSYTRPAEYRGMRVPDVLLSGDHARIAAWRREQAERLTRERRPELLEQEPPE